MAALTEPIDKADITLVCLVPMLLDKAKDHQGHRKATELNSIMSRSTRSHSAGSRNSSEDLEYTMSNRGRQAAPLEPAPRRPRKKSPRKIIILKAKRSSDSFSTDEKPSEYAMSISNGVAEEQSPHETWVPESAIEHSHRQHDSMGDLLSRLKYLERENRELRNETAEEASHSVPPPVPHYTWRTFNSIETEIFLESPQWRQEE